MSRKLVHIYTHCSLTDVGATAALFSARAEFAAFYLRTRSASVG
jgi:hypothetical protein